MFQIVQTTCPSCRHALRIPAEWVGQPIRCKHCRALFQSRRRAAPPPVAEALTRPAAVGQAFQPAARRESLPHEPTPAPVAQEVAIQAPPVAPAVAPAVMFTDPRYMADFDFGGDADIGADATATPLTRRRRTHSSGWWKPAALGAVAIAIMAAVVVVYGGSLATIFTSKKKNDGSGIVAVVKPPEKKGDDKSKQPGAGSGSEPKTSEGYFPRRALLISVNNYLFANSLHYGSPNTKTPAYPGSSTSVLARQFSVRPFLMNAAQVTELSDGTYPVEVFGDEQKAKDYGRTPHSTLKSVIQATIVEFLINSRPQDRIVLFFAGHAIDGEKDAYLAPLEGDLENPDTLIPLTWVYEQLAKCKARQKVFILDVCRFPPARGLELPAGGPMGEMLDTKLQNPPAGVQVWSSCIKEQQSLEFESGSLFMQALCACFQQGIPGIQERTDRLPVEEFVVRVNQYMKSQLEAQRMEQTSRLVGTAPADGAAYDPAVPLPDKLVLRPPLLPSGTQASAALVSGVLNEIEQIPPVRATRRSVENRILRTEYLPPFPAAALEPFKSDMSLDVVKKEVMADAAKYPLRAAILEAVKALNDNANFVMRETLTGGGGPISAKIKEAFLKMQEDPGIALFQLEGVLGKLEEAGKERDKETSKRWQAHFDYTMARLLSRLVYTYEYNFMLAQVRSESLPPLEPVHNGWRIGSRDRPQVREDKVRNYTRTIRDIWTKIKEEYPSTPWETMARRESLIALGLEWRPTRN